MKRIITLFIITLLLSSAASLLAEDAGVESPFILGTGARGLGMGGGLTALPLDGSSVYYNPAGLPLLEHQELSFMHMSLFEGTVYDVGTWASPLTGLGGVGASFMRIGTDDIIRRVDFVEQGTFSYASWQFLLGYGRQFGDQWSAGVTFKVVNSSIDDVSDYGLGLDAGLQAAIYKNLSLGLMARDLIPPQLTLDSASEEIPITIAGGLALRQLTLTDHLALNAAVDLEKVERRNPHLHAGLELLYYNRYALRAGYDRDNFSFGAGVAYGRLRIDYAYKLLEYIEDSHRFSLSFLIGPSVAEQKRRRQEAEEARGSEMLKGERERQLQYYSQKADTFYQRLQLDSALTYYQRALAFDESNQKIIGTIAAIQNVQRIQEQEERNLQQARKDQQQFVNTYYDQAVTFYNKKYYSAALDLVNLILDMEPVNYRAQGLKTEIQDALTSEIAKAKREAQLAEQQGRVVDAIEAYNRILELDPTDSRARVEKQRLADGLDVTQQLGLGIDMYNAGRTAEARRQFEAVMKITPNHPVALEYLGKLGAVTPTPPTLEDLQKDRDIWPLYLEGLRHMRNKEYDKAIAAWERVLKAYPNNSNTIENIRQARLRLQSQ